MTESSQNVNEQTIFPPRFRALKRLAMTLVVLSVSLGGLWLWWSHTASTRLKTRIAEIKARGEPLYPADFDTPPIPAEQNAAEYLRSAAAIFVKDPPSPSNASYEYRFGLPLDQSWHKEVEEAVRLNKAAIAMARKARSFDAAYWGNLPDKDVFANDKTRPLAAARMLSKLLADDALYSHLHGNDAEAIELIRDVLHIGKIVGDRPSLVGALVVTATDMAASSSIQIMAGDLNVATGGAPAATIATSTTPVTETAVRSLIRELIDENGSNDRWRRAALYERMAELDIVDRYRPASTILSPMFALDEVSLLNKLQNFARQIEQPDLMSAQALPRIPASGATDVPHYIHLLSAFVPESDRVTRQRWESTATRRMAAIALAIRLYRIHHGDWPATLDDLVPEFLPSVPLDPFAPQRRQIGYVTIPNGLPDGRPRRLLFFFASDPADPGSPSPIPAFQGYHYILRGTEWRDLTYWTLTLPATDPSDPAK